MSRSGSKTKLSASDSRCSLKGRGKKKGEAADEVEAVVEVEQLAWRVLDRSETSELAGMDEAQVARKLAAVLSLSQCRVDLSEAALLDYYVATYWFAREHRFSEEQTSTLFTIAHTLMSNLKDAQFSLPDNIRELREMLAGVGVSQQTAVQCLTPQTASLVVECVTTSLFQHYHLFQCLVEEQQDEQQIDLQLSVEVPPPPAAMCPPPLDEAIPLQLYERCLAPPPPPPQPTVQDGELAQNGEEEEVGQIIAAISNLTQEDGELLMKVSPEELKSLMDSLASDTLSAYQAEVLKKLQDKEKAFISRLSNIETSLT